MTQRSGFSQIHQAMEDAVYKNVFPGAVLVWGRFDDILFHQAYGTADLSTGDPVRLDTVFDLASLTKPLATTLAVVELIRDKTLDTATPIADILPGTVGEDKAIITIDMLLRHTSGLPAHREYFRRMNFFDTDPMADSRAFMRNMVLAEPLESPPGIQEVYSDLGFMLLAWVVEIVSGTRLDRFVRKKVFHPIGIDGLYFPGGEPEGGGRCVAATSNCPWRKRLIKGEVEDENAWAVGGVEGHAGLFGDGVSVFRLCSRILAAVEGSVQEPDPGIIKKFLEKVPGKERVAGFDTPSKEGSSSGRFFSNRAVGHLGFTGTSFWMDPVNGLIVVLLTNRVHPSRENVKIRQFRPFIHDLIYSVA